MIFPNPLSRRKFLGILAGSGTALLLAACQGNERPTIMPVVKPAQNTPSAMPAIKLPALEPATFSHLPRWRGFNLLEKFILADNSPYLEWDFDAIAGWGFNFVRLPTDYRIWTDANGAFREKPLQEIDQAVSWGRARHIHVNLCLHRAPGYCVNPPVEPLDLWADGSSGDQARQQFAAQWRMFAARFKGIPPNELSFNLVNEPADSITPAQYLRAISSAVDAIRLEDPQRLVLADGLAWGQKPVPELAPLKIAQAMHCYLPMELTHYKADWIAGSNRWPAPTWPLLSPAAINPYLYGEEKPDIRSPLVLNGDFPAGAQVSIRVDMVSHQANLQLRADGSLVFEKLFTPGAGAGEWKESTFKPEWNIYQATYDKVYTTTLSTPAHALRFELSLGDWITISEIGVNPYPGAPGSSLALAAGDLEWGEPQQSYMLDPQGNLVVPNRSVRASKDTLWNELVVPWKALADSGVSVHIGEWGAYSYTPQTVVLAWMKDCLENWQRAGFGWALWNLRGGFGLLDSERADGNYEIYQGHQLDRAMLELLQKG